MELRRMLKGRMKGQFLTLIMLLTFMLMLATLFTFALLNVNISNVAQSMSVSVTETNYGAMLRSSADSFAAASASRALQTLIGYEYAPSVRKGNFVTSLGAFMSSMITNGLIPGDISGYSTDQMGNLTLAAYNSSIAGLLGLSAQSVSINETAPVISQSSPYSLQVAYTEEILLNASGNVYRFVIPVNATVPLNNTPDLFYAQQGVIRDVKFAGLDGAANTIGGGRAVSGNSVGFAYGTVYYIQSSAGSSAPCPAIQGSLSQVASSLIIVTYNAQSLGSCINSYAGLISYVPATPAPTVPYLVYDPSSDAVADLQNGTRVLLYGPGLDTLNIEGLRSDVLDNYYFASPFASSYSERANGSFSQGSAEGIFTFSNLGRQAAIFDGASSTASTSGAVRTSSSALTVSAWVYARASDGNRGIVGQGDASGNWQLKTDSGSWDFSVYGSKDVQFGAVGLNGWSLVTVTYGSGSASMYVNGSLVSTNTLSAPNADKRVYIGYSSNDVSPIVFNGLISNVQLYNETLTPQQVQQLYQEGVSGLPVSGSELAGWWLLNGDSSDYSGNGNDATASGVSYGQLPNYVRDSALVATSSSGLSPLPGLLSCSDNSECVSNSLPHLYLGYGPLELQDAYLQAADFNGQSSATSRNVLSTSSSTLTVSAWVYARETDGNRGIAGQGDSGGNWQLKTHYGSWDFSIFGACDIVAGAASIRNWTHLVAVFGSGTANVYVDGALAASNSVFATLSSNVRVYLGTSPGDSSPTGFNGLISNVQLYNTSLTSQQVQQLYAEGLTGVPLQGAALAAWYPLDGDVKDYSGLGGGASTSNVAYPYFNGAYNAPGMSAITSVAGEWQAVGLGSPST